MWQQVNNFKKTVQQITQLMGPEAGAALIRTSIFSVTMGSNDYLNNYFVVGSPSPRLMTPRQFQDRIINTYRQQLTVHPLNPFSTFYSIDRSFSNHICMHLWGYVSIDCCAGVGESWCEEVRSVERGTARVHTVPNDTRLDFE